MEDFTRLLDEARKARDRAYAPYSGFRVGAALLCADGQVYLGGNIENASYGLTVCAERVAVFCAVASGRRLFTAIAVAAEEGVAAYPCGACLQVLHEFSPEVKVVVAGTGGKVNLAGLRELLPHPFSGAAVVGSRAGERVGRG